MPFDFSLPLRHVHARSSLIKTESVQLGATPVKSAALVFCRLLGCDWCQISVVKREGDGIWEVQSANYQVRMQPPVCLDGKMLVTRASSRLSLSYPLQRAWEMLPSTNKTNEILSVLGVAGRISCLPPARSHFPVIITCTRVKLKTVIGRGELWDLQTFAFQEKKLF